MTRMTRETAIARLANLSAGNKSWAPYAAIPQQSYDLREDAKAIDLVLSLVQQSTASKDGGERDEATLGATAALAWEPGPFSSVYDVHDEHVLLLASYCGDDNPGCSDVMPCNECLAMCNVALVRGRIKVIGGFDLLSTDVRQSTAHGRASAPAHLVLDTGGRENG